LIAVLANEFPQIFLEEEMKSTLDDVPSNSFRGQTKQAGDWFASHSFELEFKVFSEPESVSDLLKARNTKIGTGGNKKATIRRSKKRQAEKAGHIVGSRPSHFLASECAGARQAFKEVEEGRTVVS